MLARSKLNSIEKIISKAFIDNKISHENFTTIFNEEKNYQWTERKCSNDEKSKKWKIKK